MKTERQIRDFAERESKRANVLTERERERKHIEAKRSEHADGKIGKACAKLAENEHKQTDLLNTLERKAKRELAKKPNAEKLGKLGKEYAEKLERECKKYAERVKHITAKRESEREKRESENAKNDALIDEAFRFIEARDGESERAKLDTIEREHAENVREIYATHADNERAKLTIASELASAKREHAEKLEQLANEHAENVREVYAETLAKLGTEYAEKLAKLAKQHADCLDKANAYDEQKRELAKARFVELLLANTVEIDGSHFYNADTELHSVRCALDIIHRITRECNTNGVYSTHFDAKRGKARTVDLETLGFIYADGEYIATVPTFISSLNEFTQDCVSVCLTSLYSTVGQPMNERFTLARSACRDFIKATRRQELDENKKTQEENARCLTMDTHEITLANGERTSVCRYALDALYGNIRETREVKQTDVLGLSIDVPHEVDERTRNALDVLAECFAVLTDRQKSILRLVFVGMKYAEIADTLGIRRDNVSANLADIEARILHKVFDLEKNAESERERAREALDTASERAYSVECLRELLKLDTLGKKRVKRERTEKVVSMIVETNVNTPNAEPKYTFSETVKTVATWYEWIDRETQTKAERKAKNAANMREKRKNETDEQRAERKRKDSERKAAKRKNETDEQRAERKRRNAEHMREKRAKNAKETA